MIKVYDDSKIFVPCSGSVVSGGAELLHQLVSYLRDHGIDAYVYYYGHGVTDIPNDYKCYNIKLAEKIEYNPHNILILFEPQFYRAAEDTQIQKILWWLSVDNFYKYSDNYLSIYDISTYSVYHALYVFARRLRNRILRKNKSQKVLSLKDLSKLDVVSAYQSEYAQNFLQNHGFREMVPLKDYINIEHCHSFSKKGRKDIVLYNPKKGLKFTKSLIKLSPDIEWKPIINMTRQQVIDVMKTAKIYVDFGYHPGKDRLPRECAMNGLCVITGSRGSARFFEDVWLENKYKFDEKKSSKADIISRIKETLKNYEECIDDFAFYRYKIMKEKNEFENQINELFSISTK